MMIFHIKFLQNQIIKKVIQISEWGERGGPICENYQMYPNLQINKILSKTKSDNK